MGRLDGKVALVTGAARGVGAVVAKRFVDEGARVLLGDVLDDRGEATADSLGAAGRYRHLDVRCGAEWAAAVAETHEHFGALDVLVNNAALLEVAAIEETSRERLAELLDVNLIGPFLGIQAVLPGMRTAGRGSIEEIAGAILFLASDESSFCSGGDLAVDGGSTVGHIIPGAPGTY
jgi:3alpha(or 20beta)-hydroxysteroid dehydrogenase